MIQANGCADLHLHTNHSDGYYSPKELIDKTLSRGLKTVSIVDHDEIGALDEAIEYGKTIGVEVIPGVELSVSYKHFDLHVLGYCFDYRNPELVEHLNLFKKARIQRAERMVASLAKLGMPISFEAVMEKAGHGSVGRPHIANVLLDDGYVYSFQEAFNKYIGNGKRAHVGKLKIDIQVVLKFVKTAGGVCSIAHPGLELSDDDLLALIKEGVDAIEVVHPKHNDEKTRQLKQLAESNGVLTTGGSDFHGGSNGEEALGKYKVPYEIVKNLKELAARQ